MTKTEKFEMAIATVKGTENEEVLTEFFKNEIELIKNKAKSNERRKAKKAEENAELNERILEILSEVSVATAKELGAETNTSAQKVTPRLTELTNEGKVNRRVEGKNVFFSLAQ